MTSLDTFRSWKYCLIRISLLQAIFVISTSGLPCTPEVVCHPPSVQLANLTFPLRRLNVSSSCGSGNTSTAYCPADDTTCNEQSPHTCTGQHPPDLMLDVTSSSVPVNPDLTTYWQSENSVSVAGAAPTPQYIEVSDDVSQGLSRILRLTNSESAPISLLCENVTSYKTGSTELIALPSARRTEPRPPVTCRKFGEIAACDF